MTTNFTDQQLKEKIREYSKSVVGRVMYSYTEWILKEASERGIGRLYFLARDGYLLCEIAKIICKKHGLGIDCRYLYCSRQSLRMPSYHIIGDEAFDLLLLGGYYVTPKTVLERAMLSEEETDEICSSLGITERDRPFKDRELEEFKTALKGNEIYRNAVLSKSREAYESAISYFRQEG